MSRMSIPETIPESEFEEGDHEDFELSCSLAYGAVETASRLRLNSDIESISDDVERTYYNPIYEGNPIYETIKTNEVV